MRTVPKLSYGIVASLVIVALGTHVVPECVAQSVSPYTPNSLSITISPQSIGGNVSVAVRVNLPTPCHYVGDWGQPIVVGQNVLVDTQFWVITNMNCIQVITPVSTNYNLGTLPAGDYSFVFRVWGKTVKTQPFSVLATNLPNLGIVALNNSQGRISWPTNVADYSLECSTSLFSTQWTTVTNNIIVIDDKFTLDVDLTVDRMYFRLHKP